VALLTGTQRAREPYLASASVSVLASGGVPGSPGLLAEEACACRARLMIGDVAIYCAVGGELPIDRARSRARRW
jgi:hypothetical protein